MIKRYKIIILVCCVALLFNFIAKLYFIGPQSKKITILQKIVAAARSGNYSKTEPALPEPVDRKDDIQRILQAIPEEFKFTEYAAEIRLLIDKNDLSMEKSLVFVPGNIKRSDVIDYTTRIRVKGPYKNIKRLLADLQNLPGLLYLDSVNLTRIKDNPERVTLNLDLAVFFRRGGT